MIFVNRNKVNKPRFFYSKEYESRVSLLKEFYDLPRSKRSQRRFNISDFPLELKENLLNLFNNKCSYCESKLESKNSVINFFRPLSNVRGFDKNINLDYYWWLTYEWNNMYLSCIECNKYKSVWFPVQGKRCKLEDTYENIIENEDNLLIDPCNNIIENHLSYDFNTGNLIPLSQEGETTIEIFKLNRRRLVESRLSALKDEFSNWERKSNEFWRTSKVVKDKIINHWIKVLDSSSSIEFLGARKALLLHRLNNNLDVKMAFETSIRIGKSTNYNKKSSGLAYQKTSKVPSPPPGLSPEANSFSVKESKPEFDRKEILKIKKLLKNVYIEKAVLKNYKCFDFLEIDFSHNTLTDKEPWLAFLGENGVGKSSLIKAVAIALMGQKYLDELNLDASKILKYRKHSGYIRVYGSKEGEIFEVSFNKDSDYLTSNIQEPPCFLLAYGSTRLLPKGNLSVERDAEYIKAKNLFDYTVALSDAKNWMLNISPKMFNQVALSLKDLLLLDDGDLIRRSKKNETLFISYAKTKNRIDVNELSDGYKSIFAITVDIIKILSKDNLAFSTAEAIVLIDEIGTHLHPRWKMEVVSRLRKTFPKIQFIVTTHDPLCLRGLQKNEVIVLQKNDENKIIPVIDLPNPSEFRVDQLLTSKYFGLNSTMDLKTEKKFNRYYHLLAQKELSEKDQIELRLLGETLPNKKHLGDSVRDELVYYVIDSLLANEVKQKGLSHFDEEIKEKAKNRTRELWDRLKYDFEINKT